MTISGEQKTPNSHFAGILKLQKTSKALRQSFFVMVGTKKISAVLAVSVKDFVCEA